MPSSKVQIRENIYLLKTKQWSKTNKRWLQPIYFEIMRARSYQQLLAQFGYREKIVGNERLMTVIMEIKLMLPDLYKSKAQEQPTPYHRVHVLSGFTIAPDIAYGYKCQGCIDQFSKKTPAPNSKLIMHLCTECYTMYCQDCVLKIMNSPSTAKSIKFVAGSKYQPIGYPYAIVQPDHQLQPTIGDNK